MAVVVISARRAIVAMVGVFIFGMDVVIMIAPFSVVVGKVVIVIVEYGVVVFGTVASSVVFSVVVVFWNALLLWL